VYTHVAQMEAENLDFFPMNRALSLNREDEDETDTKLDELIAQVDLLVRKQRERVRKHALHNIHFSVCLYARVLNKLNVKWFPSHKAHRAALICV